MNAVVLRLRTDLDAMCDETLDAWQLARSDLFPRVPHELLTAAIRGTHERAIALLETDEETPELRASSVGFARQAARVGLSPEDVMSGYRAGAQVAEGRVRDVLLRAQVPVESVLAMWEWSGRFFDALAERTLEGVQREAVAEHGRRARAQQALLDAILDGGPIQDLTAPAAWAPPAAVRVVVARGADLDPPEAQGITGRRTGALLAIVDAEAPWLAAPSRLVAIGPEVPLEAAETSWRAARRLAALLSSQPGAESVARCDEHLVDLVLAGEPWAGPALVGRVLAPLYAAPARGQGLLRETLTAWLATPARPQAIADATGLHPQSVQYRLRRLRDVMGPALDDPDDRFALALALRLEAQGPA